MVLIIETHTILSQRRWQFSFGRVVELEELQGAIQKEKLQLQEQAEDVARKV